MSIRHGLLALLERSPMYGYQLRTEFERSTGAARSLNIGQVYTTLSRLERDGLVEQAGAADDDAKVVYALTPAGRAELTRWFDTPVVDAGRRDELAVKVALALTTPGVDAHAVIRAQRAETVRHLRSLSERMSGADAAANTALLVTEAMIFRAEAEIRWLDSAEARLEQS